MPYAGITISDATGQSFVCVGNPRVTITHKRPIGSANPLGSRTPYHTKNGSSHYYIGNISGVFVHNSDECDPLVIENSAGLAPIAIEFLHNGLTKFIQLSDEYSGGSYGVNSFILPATIMEDISIDTKYGDIMEPALEMSFSFEACGEPITSLPTAFKNCSFCGRANPIRAQYCMNCATEFAPDTIF